MIKINKKNIKNGNEKINTERNKKIKENRMKETKYKPKNIFLRKFISFILSLYIFTNI